MCSSASGTNSKNSSITKNSSIAQQIQKVEEPTDTCFMAVSLATSIRKRARGLLMTAPDDEVLLLTPYRDVHTVGMMHRLDIAFIDKTGRVLETYRDVGPFRRLRNRSAVAVVERFSSCASPWFVKDDRLALTQVQRVPPAQQAQSEQNTQQSQPLEKEELAQDAQEVQA